ncbi:recombinase family protein [Bacillus sp. AFS001701]|uniref:recombinase family protein n=1 Tax=Bacillus sp. AFS001701 TaxID=2033480 RepID=UPI000BF5F853|nr:recombinase family protein [Bacillus sp. AFS001701]PET77606.1 recombinase family protein [Bacillus sp. AFS001701]
MSSNYGVYVRISTDKDEQVSSVENQIDICRNWLEKNGFEWNDDSIHFDDAITGTAFLEREAMQVLLEKAKKKLIDLVVFKSIHRLARDLKDALEIKEVFIAHGVRLVTIEEMYDSLYEGKSDMKFEMYAMFAAQYPKTLSVSISSALAAKVRRGEHRGAKAPYGYKVNEEKKLVLNEVEAPIVAKMYDWYTNGIGLKNISNKLNEEGILTRNGTKWQYGSVRTILKNPTYKGTVVMNRYQKVKFGGRKKQIENPQEKWQVYENQHHPIVTEEVWNAANGNEIVERKKWSLVNEFRGGLAVCGKCGCNMVTMISWRKKKDGTKTEWRYMKCSAYRRGGKHLCDNHTPIRYEEFRDSILNDLLDIGKNIDLKLGNNLEEKNKKQLDNLTRQLNSIEGRIKDLEDLYFDKGISKERFIIRNKEFESKKIELQTQVNKLSEIKFTNQQIAKTKEAFEELNKKGDDLYQAFHRLINKIIVHHNGDIEIEYSFTT